MWDCVVRPSQQSPRRPLSGTVGSWEAPTGLSTRGPAFRAIARPLSRLLRGLVNEQNHQEISGCAVSWPSSGDLCEAYHSLSSSLSWPMVGGGAGQGPAGSGQAALPPLGKPSQTGLSPGIRLGSCSPRLAARPLAPSPPARPSPRSFSSSRPTPPHGMHHRTQAV